MSENEARIDELKALIEQIGEAALKINWDDRCFAQGETYAHSRIIEMIEARINALNEDTQS